MIPERWQVPHPQWIKPDEPTENTSPIIMRKILTSSTLIPVMLEIRRYKLVYLDRRDWRIKQQITLTVEKNLVGGEVSFQFLLSNASIRDFRLSMIACCSWIALTAAARIDLS